MIMRRLDSGVSIVVVQGIMLHNVQTDEKGPREVPHHLGIDLRVPIVTGQDTWRLTVISVRWMIITQSLKYKLQALQELILLASG